MNKRLTFLSLALVLSMTCYAQHAKKHEMTSLYKQNMFHLTEIMVKDVTSPPVASRLYMYCALSAYETMRVFNAEKESISHYFHWPYQLEPLDDGLEKNKNYATILALLKTGERLMPSGYLLMEKQKSLRLYFLQNGEKDSILTQTEDYVDSIVEQIIQHAKTDGYNQLSTYKRYSPSNASHTWHPTPPAYIEAIEPYWNTMRTLFIDDLDRFAPPAPIPFSLHDTSKFMNLTREVHKVSFDLSAEQKEIASFWDCNPFAVRISGHLSIGIKKISPGGHWMSIAGIACQKSNLTLEETSRVHCLVSMALYDAFISCWKEKYRSDRIRPETVINRHIDSKWRPFLQTPPFPEYTSGHSVISSCAAIILTKIFGENFEFTDDSEVIFGLPKRNFSSFLEASDEAAISRLYGGIHFIDAIEAGVKQGKSIGNYLVETIPKKYFIIASY